AAVPKTMADRTAVQVDETTLAHPSFFGTTSNAVKTQLWIAVIVLVLIHRLKHRLQLNQSPNEIAQILRVTLCEKTPINQAFFDNCQQTAALSNHNQLLLFTL